MNQGCTTMFSSNNDNIGIYTSNNREVSFSIGSREFETPVVINESVINGNKKINVNDVNCENEVTINRSIEPMIGLNIFNPFIGAIIDFSNGSAWSYEDSLIINCSD